MSETFTAVASRDEGWWVVQLEEEPGLLTQTRHFDEIPGMVRDALALFPELTSNPRDAQISVVVADEQLPGQAM